MRKDENQRDTCVSAFGRPLPANAETKLKQNKQFQDSFETVLL